MAQKGEKTMQLKVSRETYNRVLSKAGALGLTAGQFIQLLCDMHDSKGDKIELSSGDFTPRDVNARKATVQMKKMEMEIKAKKLDYCIKRGDFLKKTSVINVISEIITTFSKALQRAPRRLAAMLEDQKADRITILLNKELNSIVDNLKRSLENSIKESESDEK
jgi:hypothetical protein